MCDSRYFDKKREIGRAKMEFVCTSKSFLDRKVSRMVFVFIFGFVCIRLFFHIFFHVKIFISCTILYHVCVCVGGFEGSAAANSKLKMVKC